MFWLLFARTFLSVEQGFMLLKRKYPVIISRKDFSLLWLSSPSNGVKYQIDSANAMFYPNVHNHIRNYGILDPRNISKNHWIEEPMHSSISLHWHSTYNKYAFSPKKNSDKMLFFLKKYFKIIWDGNFRSDECWTHFAGPC